MQIVQQKKILSKNISLAGDLREDSERGE